ncbi:MAG: disulfide oxidoreductase [Alphaproteobacteria bacterium]|nr:disulfide oxidoreductase [Pseudomonadota bacterium]TDI63890.1 MAG: disulfide oxidoreductase [Alphaproteobacteria bacterium]
MWTRGAHEERPVPPVPGAAIVPAPRHPIARGSAPPAPRVTAVLGPTNTGKTYLALDRMMGHPSGMMGFPLRLLARENYDRAVAIKGADKVALVTGEEKIIPAHPSYFLCTVESMPLGREVAFLAIDEVQLAADPDRGHVFTDRILHARGYNETMLLGSDTMAPIIRRLVPHCEFISRPRFSRLSYAGTDKITRLPARSAVVAFSAAGVYGIAELLRRQRGGAAVVMGALSPRTRNAQVAMFQNGEVDYLVATDAIGMGLNMDVSHVAFGELGKFDGRARRPLSAAELAQIAGRAGRHMADGTFGTTADVGPLSPELVAALESHSFERLHTVYWRNSDLPFANLGALLRALDSPAPAPGLVAVRHGPDHLALKSLAAEDDIAQAASGPDQVRLLWEVCQIPDFRGRAGATHARFLGIVYRHLAGGGTLPDDWIAGNIDRLDRADGDIETLTGRIDQIRTWTYISNRADWVRDDGAWQARTRTVEDKLSDALHDRLTQRFVDKRTTALVKGLRAKGQLAADIGSDGAVTVEGYVVGRLDGLRFRSAALGGGDGAVARKALQNAAVRALGPEIAARLAAIAEAGTDDLAMAGDGVIRWRGAAIAHLAAGRHPLTPAIRVLPGNLMSTRQEAALLGDLETWLGDHLRRHLGPLVSALEAGRDATLAGPVRGILYRLAESLGAVPRREAQGLLGELDARGAKALARAGARLGTETVFLDGIGGQQEVRLRGLLWCVSAGVAGDQAARWVEALAGANGGAPRDPAWPGAFCRACGYVPLGARVLACARAETLAAIARKRARQGAFAPTRELRRLAGGSVDDLVGALVALGFQAEDGPDGVGFASGHGRRAARGAAKTAAKRRRGGRKPAAPASPFAKLADLKLKR